MAISDGAEFKFSVPPDAIGVNILFAPTRSRIQGVEVLAPPGGTWTDEQGRHPLEIALRWPDPTTEVSLRLDVDGEAVQPYFIDWLSEGEVSVFAEGEAKPSHETIFKWRRDHSPRPSEHAFLLEMDCQTNPNYFRYVNVPRGTGEERERTLECMLAFFTHRIAARYNTPALANSKLTNSNWIREFSRIFWASTDQLFVPSDPMVTRVQRTADALRHFGAGWLRQDMPETKHTYGLPLCEPDSLNVFFFAEFALTAIDHNVDMQSWTDLLPSLVRMQRYYMERTNPKEKLLNYGEPSRVLTDKEIQTLDAEVGHIGSIDDAVRAIRNNLHCKDGKNVKEFGTLASITPRCAKSIRQPPPA